MLKRDCRGCGGSGQRKDLGEACRHCEGRGEVNTGLGATVTYAVMFALLLTLPVAAATTWMALTSDTGYLVPALVSLTLLYGLWRSWRWLADV
jgi:hypothetical protein